MRSPPSVYMRAVAPASCKVSRATATHSSAAALSMCARGPVLAPRFTCALDGAATDG